MAKTVALGYSAGNLTTNNATSWAAVTYGNANPGRGVAWNGSVFCAVPRSGTTTYTSADGVNWTANANAMPQAGYWDCIAWNGAVFCALTRGAPNIAATSPDGVNWTQRTFPGYSAEQWSLLVWNGAVFCAISDGYTFCSTSPDGINWTNRDSTGMGDFTHFRACGIAAKANGTICIVFGAEDVIEDTTVLVSNNNGVTWTASNMPVGALGSIRPGGNNGGWRVASNGTSFCAVGGYGQCATSTDGLTWTARSIYANYQAYISLIWDGSRYIATPGNGWNVSAYSADGVSWSSSSMPSSDTWIGLASDYVPLFGAISSGDTILNVVQNVINAGNTSLALSQLITDIGQVSLSFAQAVIYPAADTVLTIAQTVSAVGSCEVSLAQTVFSFDAVTASWVNWDIKIIVAGVDISADLIDRVSIDAQRSAARIADFTVLLSGTVDPVAWMGRAVSIDYFDTETGLSWRRFKGIITNAELDIARVALACTCSDDLQRLIDLYSKDALITLTGGYWSPYVFNDKNTGWDYLQDLLQTVPMSVELNNDGALECNSLENKLAADYTFTTGQIIDETLSVKLTERSQLINKIEITFECRFERLYHRKERLVWSYPKTFAEHYVYPAQIPDKAMLLEAVTDADRKLLSASYTAMWASGTYFIEGSPVVWVNNAPNAIIAFDAMTAYRWQQTVTNRHTITVTCADSIAVHGELLETTQASAEFDAQIQEWAAADTDYSTIPSGFALDLDRNYYRDDFVSVDYQAALQAIIAEAQNRIAESHRSTTVAFSLPLAPYLDLHHTLRVDDANVTAKGIVARMVDTYDFTAGTATTAIELAISAGYSGIDAVTYSVSTQSLPTQPAPIGGVDHVQRFITTHFGGDPGSPADNNETVGYMTNYFSVSPGAVVYPVEYRLDFAAIDDKVIDATVTTTQAVNIAASSNILTITA